MKLITRTFSFAALVLLTAATGLSPIASAQAAQTERWLHVRVDNQVAKGEMVRVNLPLSLAEKVLPAINKDRLHNGRITIHEADMNGVNLRALLDALRTTRDGEFVTVQGTSGDVRVVKLAGYLLVDVRGNKDATSRRVEIRMPLTVVDALLSSGGNELDLVAALRALGAQGDTELVSVKDEKSTVRIWLDSKNTSE
jgi:hypothetical protein